MSDWSLRLQSLSDRLNPVAVKELRQIAEGRFILFLLLGLVGAESLFVGGTLLVGGSGQTLAVGRTAFNLLYGILSLSCLVLVPVYIGWRLAAERYGKEMDLIYITAISPRHIVSGKLLSAVALTTLIFSTFLPFLGLTYYLRGVDLNSIFGLVLFSFISVVVATLAAMVLGALPVSRGMKIFLAGLSFLFVLQFAGIGVVALMAVMMGGGGGGLGIMPLGIGFFSTSGSASLGQAWAVNLFVLVLMGTIALLLFQVAVALLTPAAANRSAGFRLSLAASWLVSGAAAGSAGAAYSSPDFVTVWCVIFALIISAGFFTAVSERHSYGRRILRGVPRQGWPRAKAFLLASGAASALAVYIVLGLLTLLAAYTAYLYGFANNHQIMEAIEVSAGLMMYGLGYSLIGLLIFRSLPSGRLHSKRSGLIALGVLALASISPLTVGALLAPEAYWNTETGFRNFLMGNPIALVFDTHRGAYVVLGMVLAAGGLIGNASWLADRYEEFRPPPKPFRRPSGDGDGRARVHG